MKPLYVLFIPAFFIGVNGAGNLSCYQCTTTSSEPCAEESLLPCPPNKDRCVTHITRDRQNGYSMKRECGLGPCGFEDVMVNRGLGLDTCDMTKEEIFCVFCCRESGCNGSNLICIQNIEIFLTISLLYLTEKLINKF